MEKTHILATVSIGKRIGIVLSALWLVIIYAGARDYNNTLNMGDFAGFGVIPLTIIWGIYWIIAGFKNKNRGLK